MSQEVEESSGAAAKIIYKAENENYENVLHHAEYNPLI